MYSIDITLVAALLPSWELLTEVTLNTYHQVKINDSETYTAFQAGNALYQFTRVHFGVTNGVACFYIAMDSIITEEQLQATFLHLDNITIRGEHQREHDVNLKDFLEAASRWQIKYNDSKYMFSTLKLAILGSIIEEGDIRPEPERQRTLQVLPVPEDGESLCRILGFFSYYSQWIHCYSEKIWPLATVSNFPISMGD